MKSQLKKKYIEIFYFFIILILYLVVGALIGNELFAFKISFIDNIIPVSNMYFLITILFKYFKKYKDDFYKNFFLITTFY